MSLLNLWLYDISQDRLHYPRDDRKNRYALVAFSLFITIFFLNIDVSAPILKASVTFSNPKRKFVTGRSKAVLLLWFISFRFIFINVACCMTL